MENYVFAVEPSFLESDELRYDYHILKDGRNPYTGETEADYRAAGLVILSCEEFNTLWKKKEDALTGDWKEETEEDYENSLDVLPPLRWTNGGFFVSEAFTGNIYSFHQRYNGKYYTSLQRISTPRSEIMESLKTFVESCAA